MTDDDTQARFRDLARRIEDNAREFRRLGRAVWRVQEDERRRLARELHDGVGQNLTALGHRLRALAATPGLDDAVRAGLDDAVVLCTGTLDDTRELSRLLRPQILDDLGLEAALRWLARTAREGGAPPVALEIAPLPALDGELQTLLFRISQEALNNMAKHADASRATLALDAATGWMSLRIADDGVGFDPASVAGGGSGLGGMAERVRLYGGTLRVDAAPGRGTRIDARVPIDADTTA